MATLYLILLTLHNLTRWLVLIAGVWALLVSVRGIGGARPFTPADRRPVALFAGSVHLQVVLGLLLFGLLGATAGRAFSDAPRASFQWEHLGLMLVAAVFATLASALSRRAASNQAGFRVAALWSGLALVVILVGIPWWRPLLRLFS
ncbi:hypothetical protein DAETH_19710 [Deinococcus aetherius]|uniref:Uncharacterized protein n=1 Tax=Deinococcus aetherius TaxID=200252 RepID=A0ABM8ADX9_9DEIO|nr:hypothetical protein [Deinococcus aetherius]BDP42002.1 hypothetical protein DAETH_19710 [Deinococcus aetherius]